MDCSAIRQSILGSSLLLSPVGNLESFDVCARFALTFVEHEVVIFHIYDCIS